MKLCIDCKHFAPGVVLFSFSCADSCVHPNLMRVEPVRGRTVYRHDAECDPTRQRSARADANGLGQCGDAAEWFEQKEVKS